jgi:tetratricopeptide (TPR) repeat protein
LIPSDLERLLPPGEDAFAWAKVHLRARLVAPGGLPSLVPARQANGHCHWLQNDRCAVWQNSPYACAFFGHLGKEQIEVRNEAGRAARREAFAQNTLYARIWQSLKEAGLTSTGTADEPLRVKSVADALEQARQCYQTRDLERVEALSKEILRRQPTHPEALYLLGDVARREHRLEEALRYFQRVLRIQPRSAETHFARGLTYQEQGQLDAALGAFREAVRLRPSFVAASSSLGLLLQAQGQPHEAESCFRQVLNLCPTVPQAHAHLAGAVEAQGRYEEAKASYREALRLDPSFAAAHNNLGNLLLKQGNLAEAAACFAQAIRLQPQSAEGHYNLGVIWQEQGRLAEAAACYQHALGLQPDFAAAYNALGMVCVEDDQRGPAIECFEQVLRLEPNQPLAHANLGTFFLEDGRRAEATVHYQQALHYDPNCIPALAAVTYYDLFPLEPEQLARMDALLADSNLPASEASQLAFGLAAHCDRAGDYDQAFAHLHRANGLRRRVAERTGNAFDAVRHRARVDEMIATCGPAFFQRVGTLGSATERLVFIVGMPRSGTSLVEQILASHPEMFGAGELPYLSKFATSLGSRLGEAYPGCLTRLDVRTIQELADRYLEQITRRNGTAERVTDKNPLNFEHLGLIAALFPRARVIHCQREPMDVGLSCYFQNFRDVTFSSDLSDLGSYYREYERLMGHWRSVLPLPILDVRYEDLIDDVETVSKRLVSFCGLDWDDRCLSYYQKDRTVRTVSQMQVRQPVYKSSKGRCHRYAAHLKPFAEGLGR